MMTLDAFRCLRPTRARATSLAWPLVASYTLTDARPGGDVRAPGIFFAPGPRVAGGGPRRGGAGISKELGDGRPETRYAGALRGARRSRRGRRRGALTWLSEGGGSCPGPIRRP